MWISAGGDQLQFTITPADDEPDEADQITDEGPVLLRLAPALPPAVPAPDSLPPLKLDPDERAAVSPAPPEDQSSTGLFESWDWDEADPYTTGEFPSLRASAVDLAGEAAATPGDLPDPYLSRASRGAAAARDLSWEREMTGPRLAVVQQAPVEEDYSAERAAPLPIPPRPLVGAATGGPLRAFRPAPAEVPPDWLDDDRQDTLIVIDPTLPPARPRVAVAFIDAGAWALGFAATFVTGLVTTASGGLLVLVLLR